MTFQLPPIQSALEASADLVAIVADRISQTIAPETQGRPYVVWLIVSSIPENTLSCAPSIDDQRIQIDFYSASQSQAREMMQAGVDAVADLGYIVFGPWTEFEDLPKMYRWSFDVEVWNSR